MQVQLKFYDFLTLFVIFVVKLLAHPVYQEYLLTKFQDISVMDVDKMVTSSSIVRNIFQ